MPIPTVFNPMGKNEKKYFEVIVKPGILASDMTYGIYQIWNEPDGYFSVDWGDGSKEEATSSKLQINHTYSIAGTYRVKIKANCSRINCRAAGSSIIYDCSANYDSLTNLTDASWMFQYCSSARFTMKTLPETLVKAQHTFDSCTNAQLPLTSLPCGLMDGGHMFNGCTNAQLPLTSLPDGLQNGATMFRNCKNAEINLDTLVANAPADGWTSLTNIGGMFYGCSKVTGSRSAFLAKCPNVPNADQAFTGTNTTE